MTVTTSNPEPQATGSIDAGLVRGYLAGDRSALAGIYDRYSAGLYDTAAAMLRDRHEAADAMQDVFLIAAERMAQLREPERLKPWLFAILRNEVYRRTRRRGRAIPTDFAAPGVAEMAAPTQADAEGEMVAAGELAEMVRGAAHGLDERDQLVLELSIRQGLQGADLAAALGVSADQSYTMVHRMRDRVDRSLGAFAVAKAGRRDCSELGEILRGWDGEFTVLIRKRVARHIENCATCERTKRRVAPIALLSAAPALAAPPGLRDQVLGLAGRPGSASAHAYEFDLPGGFPRAVRVGRRLAAWVAPTAAACLLAIGGGAALVANNSGGTDELSAATTTAVVAPPSFDTDAAPVETTAATTPAEVPSTADPSTTTVAPSTTLTPTTPPPAAGDLDVSTTLVDLGRDSRAAIFDITNVGGQPIAWALITGDVAPFSIDNEGSTIAPGQRTRVIVGVDRSDTPEGTVERIVDIDLGGGELQRVTLRAGVERPPRIERPTTGVAPNQPPPSWCQNSRMFETFIVTDESGLTLPVTFSWTGPGTPATVTLPPSTTAADRFGGPFASPDSSGTYNFVVTATDTRGNVGTLTGTFVVDVCPG
jgi:RNA polymerase sigma factor (sigma-70 family)